MPKRKPTSTSTPSPPKKTRDTRLYTLDVFIIEGPVTKEFAKRNPVLSRTIQIRGSQTLEQLHKAIFAAFDRYDPHMYEFQFGGKGPMDPNARRYVLSGAYENPPLRTPGAAGDVARTSIGSLGLKVDDRFGYWFDFGDDWWHQINVVSIEHKVPRGRFPKLTKRVGDSPPQYIECEEEEG